MTQPPVMPDPDAVDALGPVMRAVAEGKLRAADMERMAAERSREMFCDVVGPDDPLWPDQVAVARGVLAHNGIPAAELQQWLSAVRSHENPDMAMLYAPGPVSPVLGSIGAREDDVKGEPIYETASTAAPPPSVETKPCSENPADKPAPSDCGCDTTSKMTTLPDGRTVPTRLIAARGSAAPFDGLEPM